MGRLARDRIIRLTAGILRRPWVVIAGTVLLLAGSAWGASGVKVDHALLDQFDPEIRST